MATRLAVVQAQNDTDIGIDQKGRQQAAQAVARILAGTYALYLKTQYYHWNVVGAEFYNLHLMFEEQYKQLRKAVDEVAERIRALGAVSPGTFREFSEANFIEEDARLPENWRGMVSNLEHGHERLAKECRRYTQELADTKDEGTIDMLIQRMKAHEKTAWMLRSLLRNNPATGAE